MPTLSRRPTTRTTQAAFVTALADAVLRARTTRRCGDGCLAISAMVHMEEARAATAALAFHITPIHWRLEFARPWLNEWQVQEYATFEAECRWEQKHGTLDGFRGRSGGREAYKRVNHPVRIRRDSRG